MSNTREIHGNLGKSDKVVVCMPAVAAGLKRGCRKMQIGMCDQTGLPSCSAAAGLFGWCRLSRMDSWDWGLLHWINIISGQLREDWLFADC